MLKIRDAILFIAIIICAFVAITVLENKVKTAETEYDAAYWQIAENCTAAAVYALFFAGLAVPIGIRNIKIRRSDEFDEMSEKEQKHLVGVIRASILAWIGWPIIIALSVKDIISAIDKLPYIR
jgi:hypothetical protein